MARVQTPAHLRREYECIYLIDQALEEPMVDQVIQRYRDVVSEQGGKVVRIDNWGKRKLAYEIDKQQKATYVYMQLLASGELVAELERTMRLSDDIVRFMTVVIDEDVDPNARPEASEVTRRLSEEEEEEQRRAAEEASANESSSSASSNSEDEG